MKKLFFTLTALLLPFCLAAQNEDKAREILEKVVATFNKEGCIQIDFDGTESGSMIMKGEKFYLHSNHIQSWYDGQTLWSYVADTEEVNVSHPTNEDLQSINPYFILTNYQNHFTCQYRGTTDYEGKQVYEIELTPRNNANSEKVILKISKSYNPASITIEKNGKTISDINIRSLQKQQQIKDQVFRFNKSLYPNAEIIDLR